MTNDLVPSSKFLLYTSPQGDVRLDVFLKDETLWLTQKMIAELFGVEVHTINYHLKEIFKSGELSVNSVIRKIRVTAPDGKGRVSKESADKKALLEYKEFNKTQPIESDFDKVVKKLIKSEKNKGK